MSPADSLYPREGDGGGLSKQNIIIIAACSSVGGLIITFILFRIIRSRGRSSHSVPLPPPQPLAHHREQQLAHIHDSLPRVATWYDPQLSATSRFRSTGSNISLLGKEASSPSTVSIPPSTEAEEEPALSADSSTKYLPPPNASFHLNRPGSSSSLGSSDASCTTSLPITPDSSTPSFGKAMVSSSSTPFRRQRPLSMASSNTTHTMMSARRGVPHAPHNQIQIILPSPLASGNNGLEALARPRSKRYDSDAGDRRSVADPWINIGPASTGPETKNVEENTAGPARRRHASMGFPSSGMHPVLYEEQGFPPVITDSGGRKLEKPRRSQADGKA